MDEFYEMLIGAVLVFVVVFSLISYIKSFDTREPISETCNKLCINNGYTSGTVLQRQSAYQNNVCGCYDNEKIMNTYTM